MFHSLGWETLDESDLVFPLFLLFRSFGRLPLFVSFPSFIFCSRLLFPWFLSEFFDDDVVELLLFVLLLWFPFVKYSFLTLLLYLDAIGSNLFFTSINAVLLVWSAVLTVFHGILLESSATNLTIQTKPLYSECHFTGPHPYFSSELCATITLSLHMKYNPNSAVNFLFFW